MPDHANARNLLDKLRTLSQRTRRKFDDIPDGRTDGFIDKINAKKFADESLGEIQKDAKLVGVDLEVKVVGIALRVVMLDPDDPTRTKMVTTEIALTHPKIDLMELMSITDSAPSIDGDRLLHKDNEDMPYEPKSKYDGLMYG